MYIYIVQFIVVTTIYPDNQGLIIEYGAGKDLTADQRIQEGK